MLTSLQRRKGVLPPNVQFSVVNDQERRLSATEWEVKYGHMQADLNPKVTRDDGAERSWIVRAGPALTAAGGEWQTQIALGGGRLVRRRGQMTQMAAQAQENDSILKAKWAENREAKKAAAMRYGFI